MLPAARQLTHRVLAALLPLSGARNSEQGTAGRTDWIKRPGQALAGTSAGIGSENRAEQTGWDNCQVQEEMFGIFLNGHSLLS